MTTWLLSRDHSWLDLMVKIHFAHSHKYCPIITTRVHACSLTFANR